MHWLYSPSIMDYLAMMHISYVGPRLSFILVMLIFKISLFKTEKISLKKFLFFIILYLCSHFSTQSSPQPSKSNMCKAHECFS